MPYIHSASLYYALQVMNTVPNPIPFMEGAPPLTIGYRIALRDADSVNSNVTVSEVTISVDSDVEMLSLPEGNSDITVSLPLWFLSAMF